MDQYGKILLAHIMSTGKTQTEVAAELGIDQSRISRWISTKKHVQVPLAVRPQIEKLVGYKLSEHCPMENICPIWNDGNVSYIAGAIIQSIKRMTAYQQQQALVAVAKVLKVK